MSTSSTDGEPGSQATTPDLVEIDLREADRTYEADRVVIQLAENGSVDLIELGTGIFRRLILPDDRLLDLAVGTYYESLLVVGDDHEVAGARPGWRVVPPEGYEFVKKKKSADLLIAERAGDQNPLVWKGPDRPPVERLKLAPLHPPLTPTEMNKVLRDRLRLHLVHRDDEVIPVIPGHALAELPALVDRAREEIRRDDRREAVEGVRRRYAAERNDRFINPFAFVAIPGVVNRERPVGHGRLQPDRVSGEIHVEWEALSPLLLRGHRRDDGVWALPRPAGKLRLPGSSVKGAVRSLHEALSGGCLRVVDRNFLPVYRETASTSHRAGWTLGLIHDVDRDGRPTEVRLTKDVLWVRATDLAGATGSTGIAEGQRFEITVTEQETQGRRLMKKGTVELVDTTDHGVGQSVALLRPVGARIESGPKKQTFWCATGTITDGTLPLDPDAWSVYQRSLAHTEAARRQDVSRSDQDNGSEAERGTGASESGGPAESIEAEMPEQEIRRFDTDANKYGKLEEVYFAGQFLGHARGARRQFKKGQVIWCKQEGGRITKIALSNLWRVPGRGTVGERLETAASASASSNEATDGAWPCTDAGNLCISCRVFGSADTDSKDTFGARQSSYRGHVRFSEAWPIDDSGDQLDDLATTEIDLATTAAPRPGSGQFYLRSYKGRDTVAAEGEPPIRNWGSAADSGSLRALAGRKFYWHGNPEHQERPRHRPRTEQPEQQRSDVEIAPTSSRWACRIRFENLSPAEAGSLLAALQPALVLSDVEVTPPVHTDKEPDVFAVHLGGGKPFGLSSMRPTVKLVDVWAGTARYAKDGPPVPTEAHLVAAFVESAGPVVEESWPELAAMLLVGQVDPGRIWYPPGRSWLPTDAPVSDEELKEFDESMLWFKNTVGHYTADRDRPIVPLPRPNDLDPSLHVTGAESRRRSVQ